MAFSYYTDGKKIDPRDGFWKREDGDWEIMLHHELHGVEVPMIDWWFTWHPLESLHYKLWNNKVHYGTQLDEKSLARITDKSLSYRKRLWGTVHTVVEDIGTGSEEIHIPFVSPAEFGFDMQRYEKSNVLTAIMSVSERARMIHLVRLAKSGKGIEMRTRFGINPPNLPLPKKLVNCLVRRKMTEAIKGLTFHALEEYTHLGNLLPLLWEDPNVDLS